MSPDEQILAIAKACGEEWEKLDGSHWPYQWKRNGIKVAPGIRPRNYPEDLNAMHEAEKVLTDTQYHAYCALLDEEGKDDRGFGYTNRARSLPANARAEMFLRVLNYLR